MELGATTYNGIDGGETKQKDGTHDHGNKRCSIVTTNGDGTLICGNRGGKDIGSLSKMATCFAFSKQSGN